MHIAAGAATAPRLCSVWCVRLSPHSRLRRQCGVIDNVTAHAVIITDNQMVTIVDCRGVWQYAQKPLAETAEVGTSGQDVNPEAQANRTLPWVSEA